jgi:hypothetical protein
MARLLLVATLLVAGCTERGCLIIDNCLFPAHPEAADWRRVKQICDADPSKCATAVSVMQDTRP